MRTGILMATLLVAALALPTAQARATDCDGMDAKIGAAMTAADHEAIAACYDGEAKAVQAKLAEHQRMRASYKKAGPAAIGKFDMLKHCDHVIASLQNEEKMYEEMAKAHRNRATHAK